MIVGELYMVLGVRDKLSSHLQKAGTRMKSLTKSALLGTTAVAGLGVAFGVLTNKGLQLSNQLSSFHASTGLSAQQLQKFSQIAEYAGSSSQDLKASIEGIQQAKAKLNMGEGNAHSWALLGLNPKDNPFTTLEKLRKQLKDVQNPQQLANIKEFMSGVGISKGLLPMLKLTDKQMKRMSKNTFVLGDKSIVNMEKARVLVKMLGNVFSWLKNTVLANLAPDIKKISEVFREWLVKHKEEMITTIQDIGKGVLKFIKYLPTLIKMVDNIVKSMGGWKPLLISLGVAFAGFKIASFVAMLNPLTVTIMSVAFALILLKKVYDEIKDIFTGQSVNKFSKTHPFKMTKERKETLRNLQKEDWLDKLLPDSVKKYRQKLSAKNRISGWNMSDKADKVLGIGKIDPKQSGVSPSQQNNEKNVTYNNHVNVNIAGDVKDKKTAHAIGDHAVKRIVFSH